MAKSRRPSLRNFAVISKAGRCLFGCIYRVQDRRTSQPPQFLFVPNKFRCWPRYLEMLSPIDGTCIRLRDGKVSFLLPANVGLDLLRDVLKLRRKWRMEFNPVSGFATMQTRSKGRFLTAAMGLLTISLGSLSLVSVFQHQTVAQKVRVLESRLNTTYCVADSFISKSFKWTSGENEVQIQKETFDIASAAAIGGFLHATLQGNCIRKPFSIDAWYNGVSYQISGVN